MRSSIGSMITRFLFIASLALLVGIAGAEAQPPQPVRDLLEPPYEACERATLEGPRSGNATVEVRVLLENAREERDAILCVWDSAGRKVFQESLTLPRSANRSVVAHVPGGSYVAELDVKEEQVSLRAERRVDGCASGIFEFVFRTSFVTEGPNQAESEPAASYCVEPAQTSSDPPAEAAPPSDRWNRPPTMLGAAASQPDEAAWATVAAMGGLGIVALFVSPRTRWILLSLFSRILRHRILDQETRSHVFELVRSQPAVHAAEVARVLQLSRGHALYHLNVLVRERVLSSVSFAGLRRFFVTGSVSPPAMRRLSAMRHRHVDHLLRFVGGEPGLTVGDAASRMRVTHSFVSKLSRRLEAVDLLERRARGKTVQLFLRAGV